MHVCKSVGEVQGEETGKQASGHKKSSLGPSLPYKYNGKPQEGWLIEKRKGGREGGSKGGRMFKWDYIQGATET